MDKRVLKELVENLQEKYEISLRSNLTRFLNSNKRIDRDVVIKQKAKIDVLQELLKSLE